ncbi:mannonate dehydratase [Salipaludibacillus agaradhaerens]|uniref:Mannonate dehydratase n=1 Tax=Salipaludibacillus agaradhaerens TaxID=76935 RepID=A0A9Q4AZZ0_SALAG|nr:mannonate dehydratase [Salipaludibacillus agaradhaerens]MCR6095856.1 mannonate dehydratase [Salipaludibacillus agaradhaerens]MCR6114585.1 mannonate dehydratase [Salipaludibacillus agaradhaerens]
MKMMFRWFGPKNDPISLAHIRHIPGVEGVVWALHDIPVGEVWPLDTLLEVKKVVERHGFTVDVVESVNVHEDIKLGLTSRKTFIDHYKRTIENLGKLGVKVICYNFMPVFDWTRTDLFKHLPDGSTAMFYEKAIINNIKPSELITMVSQQAHFSLPGWELERLDYLSDIFRAYEGITEDDLWENLRFFLEEIIPVAAENDIKMAIHPDDPPWPIFGLPRIVTSQNNIRQLLNLVKSDYNGVTLCSGSLGINPSNDVPAMIREFAGRIPFAHIRNVKVFENGDFIETSHRSQDGSIDIYEVVKAYHDIGFTGYVRPDHGRHIWGESGRPGYGLYDRGLGIMYLWGIWDSLNRLREKEHLS